MPRTVSLIMVMLLLAISVGVPAGSNGGSGQPGERSPAATLLLVQGPVTIFSAKPSGQEGAGGTEGQLIFEGDRIVTGDDALAVLVLKDKSTVKIHAHTDLQLTNVFVKGDKALPTAKPVDIPTRLKLFWGRIWATVEKQLDLPSVFEVETPNSSAAVHGTSFEVIVLPVGAEGGLPEIEIPKKGDPPSGPEPAPPEPPASPPAGPDNKEEGLLHRLVAQGTLPPASDGAAGLAIETTVNVWEGKVSVKNDHQTMYLSQNEAGKVSLGSFVPRRLSPENVTPWQAWNLEMDGRLKGFLKQIPPGEFLPRRLPPELRRDLPKPPKMELRPRHRLPRREFRSLREHAPTREGRARPHPHSRAIRPLVPIRPEGERTRDRSTMRSHEAHPPGANPRKEIRHRERQDNALPPDRTQRHSPQAPRGAPRGQPPPRLRGQLDPGHDEGWVEKHTIIRAGSPPTGFHPRRVSHP